MFKCRVQNWDNCLTIPPTVMEKSSLQQGDELYWIPHRTPERENSPSRDKGAIFAPAPDALPPADSILGPTTITSNNRVTIPKDLIYKGDLWYGDHVFILPPFFCENMIDWFLVLPITDEESKKHLWRHLPR